MKKTIILLIFGVLILSETGFASIGEIVAKRGDAWADNSSQKRDLKIKSKIFKNDRIETGKRGRLQIMFLDETIASLGPESIMIVKDYTWNEQSGKFETEAKQGLFHIMGGKMVGKTPENFKVKTPVASIGIRGSMFAFKISEEKLSIVFLGGKGIDIKTEIGTTAILKPGFGTEISKSQKQLKAPFKFNEKKINNLTSNFVNPPPQRENNQNSPQDKKQNTQPNNSLKLNEELSEKSKIEKKEKIIEELPEQPTEPEDPDPQNPIDPSPTDPEPNQPETPPEEPSEPPEEPQEPQNPETPPGGTIIFTSGSYVQVNADSKNPQNTLASKRNGTSTAKINSQSLNIKIYDDQGTISENNYENFNQPSPSVEYDGVTSYNVDYKFRINDKDEVIKASLMTSDLNEFYVLHVDKEILDLSNSEIFFTATGYFGRKSEKAKYPTEQLGKYQGFFSGSMATEFSSTNYLESYSGVFATAVNWTNKRIMGALYPGSQNGESSKLNPIYFFGSISEDGVNLENMNFIGSKVKNNSGLNYPSNYPEINIYKTEESGGLFFGSKYQGIGFNTNNSIMDMDTLEKTGDSIISAGGFKVPGNFTIVNSSTPAFKGFIVGISESISNPVVNRKIFMNQDSSDFSLNFNRSTGVVSGSFKASEINNSSGKIESTIGGTTLNSAYLDDKAFMALLSGNVGEAAGAAAQPLKDNSSFLVTEKPHADISEYVSWGYWEASYNDPETGKTHHIHSPGSYWVAGEVTTQAKLSELSTASNVLSYTGESYSVKIDEAGNMHNEIKGKVKLNADLAASTLTGFIQPDSEVTSTYFSINGDIESSGKITGGFLNAEGNINGCFFGPNAESVAGSFKGELNNNNYYGIYIGNR